MSRLSQMDLVDSLRKFALRGSPLLGICVGMQILVNNSEEGKLRGLGVVDGVCRRLPSKEGWKIRVPHIGWNRVVTEKSSLLFGVPPQEQRFYFCHSYYVDTHQHLATAYSIHGIKFCVAYEFGNVMGVQFHPEKSGESGWLLLQNFGSLRC